MLQSRIPPRSRPVVALMGEFSAGKSTLANLLLGDSVSPVRVTATQLPPIWYTYGAGRAAAVAPDGTAEPVDLADLRATASDETAYLKIELRAGVLELMDIIDMPGISDPNMSPSAWKRIIHNADCVIWCSHATQAWRQSEAATWGEFPPALYPNSLLLLTRMDKLLNENDRRRVMARVRSETKGLFGGVFPISLSAALEAGEDKAAWEESGAEPFMQKLLDTVFALTPARAPARAAPPAGAPGGNARRPASEPLARPARERPEGAETDAAPVRRVVPRRVTKPREGGARTARPGPTESGFAP